jgi:hypothetical protein
LPGIGLPNIFRSDRASLEKGPLIVYEIHGVAQVSCSAALAQAAQQLGTIPSPNAIEEQTSRPADHAAVNY